MVGTAPLNSKGIENPNNYTAAAATAKSLQSCLTLCVPIDISPPGSPAPGTFQARTLEWVAFPTPKGLPELRIQPTSLVSPSLAGGFFTIVVQW